MFDPELYRAKEEVERWKEHDPITMFRERIDGLLTDADVEEIEARGVGGAGGGAVAAAEQGSLEPASELTRHVTFEGDGGVTYRDAMRAGAS